MSYKPTKKFNTRRCPYKQLKEFKGKEALIYVYSKPDKGVDRIRLVSPKKIIAYSGYKACSVFNYVDSSTSFVKYRSCFNYPYYSWEETIDAMKKYDEECDLKIIYIEFN